MPNESQLELPAQAFYSRLNPRENAFVGSIVTNLANFMSQRLNPSQPFSIAGVGSLLRYSDQSRANDIDLAVSGLKYTESPANHRNHNFGHVVHFTNFTVEYFAQLRAHLLSQGIDSRKIYDYSGTGPFEGLDSEFNLSKGDYSSGRMLTALESFGWFGSKGLQLKLEGMRGIDIQFAFNQTPEEWKINQVNLRENPEKSGRVISNSFPYAMLVESRN